MTPFIAFSVGVAVGLALGLIFRNKAYEKALAGERILTKLAQDELLMFKREAAAMKANGENVLSSLKKKK